MYVPQIDVVPLLLTLKLAVTNTVLLFLLSIPVSYYLAYTRSRFKPYCEAAVALPLVLPPSVLGFYLLLLFSKKGFLGNLWDKIFGYQLAFHFDGLLIASFIFSLPFMVQPLVAGFKSVGRDLIEASYTLGKSKPYTLFKIILPNMKSACLTGIVLTFAHTIGEFGVVLMIGGNIDGETKVVSIAIYDAVERLDYTTAHIYALILFIFTFIVLAVFYRLNKRYE